MRMPLASNEYCTVLYNYRMSGIYVWRGCMAYIWMLGLSCLLGDMINLEQMRHLTGYMAYLLVVYYLGRWVKYLA